MDNGQFVYGTNTKMFVFKQILSKILDLKVDM